MAKRSRRAKRKNIHPGPRVNPARLVIRNPSKRRRRHRNAQQSSPLRSRRRRSLPSARGAWGALLAAHRARKPISPAELKQLAKIDPEFRKALLRYRRFHGGNPDEITFCKMEGVKPGFRYGVALGHARAHEYEVPRSSGRSNGPPYRHAFDKGMSFTVTSPDGKGPYIVKRPGSKLRVTDRGIIG